MLYNCGPNAAALTCGLLTRTLTVNTDSNPNNHTNEILYLPYDERYKIKKESLLLTCIMYQKLELNLVLHI